MSLSCIVDIKSRRLRCLSWLRRKKTSSTDKKQSLYTKTKCKYMEAILIITAHTVFDFSFDCFLKKIALEPISSISRNRKIVIFVSDYHCRSINIHILNEFLVGSMFINILHSRLYGDGIHQQFIPLFLFLFISIKKVLFKTALYICMMSKCQWTGNSSI